MVGGAWEVASRLSYLDLDSGPIKAGQMTDYTFGVNWFLNPYSKIVFNYIHAFVDLPASNTNTDIFAMRCQVDS